MGICLQPVVIVGPKNAGKTTYLKNLLFRCQKLGLTVGGFLSVNSSQDQPKSSYYLLDIRSQKIQLFISRQPEFQEFIKLGEYYLNMQCFAEANKILKTQLKLDVILLDEFGPLEKMKKGFREGLDYLLKNFRGILVITVRPTLLPHLKKLVAQKYKTNFD